MAFMMPVVKNDWDIYNSARTRRPSENERPGGGGRVRKVSESRSEGPAPAHRSAPLSPHRSAPAMRSLSYVRAPPRAPRPAPAAAAAAASARAAPRDDKFHTRLVDKLKRALGREPRAEERTS